MAHYLGFGLLFLLPAAHGATPEAPKSVFWEPYRYDGSTTGLYHFDEEETGGAEAVLDAPESGESGGHESGLLEGEKGEGRGPANAVMSGKQIELLGDCRRAAGQGRFGGGVLFQGTDGRIAGELPGGARTLEFWMRPERPPAGAATVAHVSAPRLPNTIALRLTPEGTLVLDWVGQAQPVPGYKFREGQWVHLAIAWDGRAVCEFRLDGDLVSFEKPLQPAGTEKLTQYVVGNDRAGKSGFRGVIDEVRVSSAVRQYYRHTFGWTKAERRAAAGEGQPFFRDADDLLFRLDFNRTVIPAKAPPGATPPEETAETRKHLQFIDPESPRPPFADGIEEQALVVGKDGAPVEYLAPGLLSPERGSIALWIRPLNWNNHVLWNPFAPFRMKTVPVFAVTAGGKGGAAYLTLLQTPNVEAWQYPVDVNPGRWLHLCLTWEKGRRAAYLDGKPWPYWGAWSWEVKPWAAGQELALRFGRDESLCALDDFRVYRRALSPSEVANLAALFDPRREVRPLPPLEMTFDYNGVLGRVDVQLYPLSPGYAKADGALVTVAKKGADQPIGQQEFRFEGCPEVRGRVNTPPMEFGAYEVKAVARDAAGKVACEAASVFERIAPPWWGNKLGVRDKVMPGWTPVAVKDRTLSVVLRDVRFSDSGLPESVVSAGAEILAGPVALVAEAGGKPEALQPVAGAFSAETRGEVRADFSGQAAGAGLRAAIQGSIEFDGMMWFQVTLTPINHQPLTINQLLLTIPYTEDASRLLHWWSGNHGFRDPRVVHIGATPAGEGVVFSCLDKSRVALYGNLRGSFMPYVMLTGDRRGMAWFAENDRGWTQSRESPAVAIRRQGQTVSLVLNVISEKVALDGPRSFEFGLHPIPVKPLEKGWRMTPSWGVLPDSFCGFNLKGPQPTQFYRHPDNLDWDMVAKRFRGELGSQGAVHREAQFAHAFRREFGRDPKPRETMVVGLYHDLSGIAAFPDHTREWGGEVWWNRRYTPEMVDYCAWIWNEWVRRGFAKGIYYDNCFNYPLDSWPSPVTYKLPDGKVQPGFQWRQIREHLKRTRQILHDNGHVPHLCTHTTHTFFIPYHSFFDVILDGEDFYQSPGEKRDFMDSWPPDRMRFMNPEKWGLITTWLGWYAGAGEDWPKFQTLAWQHWRAYTAALLVNDIAWTVSSHLGGRHEVDAGWLKASKLCLDPETEFVPYWSSGRVASHTQKSLYVSAWKRPGWCAAALVNWSRERIEAEVRLDPRAMGFGDASPDTLAVRDVDSSLLRYFDEDVTKMKAPDADKADETALLDTPDKAKAGAFEAGTGKEEDELDELGFKKKVTVDDRKAKDPDGKLEWKDGVLRCPVRPHDFRLLEFRSPAEPAGGGR